MILPVKASNEVTDVIRQNDSVFSHVPVITEYTHRHMSGYLRQLPQNVIISPIGSWKAQIWKTKCLLWVLHDGEVVCRDADCLCSLTTVWWCQTSRSHHCSSYTRLKTPHPRPVHSPSAKGEELYFIVSERGLLCLFCLFLSHDPSEIIQICWFGAQGIFCIIINLENSSVV